MSIYNPLSSSYDPNRFLDYRLFNVTSSIPVSSSERTPTSSAQLRSGSDNVFLLSASAAFTAGLNVQTTVNLNSYVYNNTIDVDLDPTGALHYHNLDKTEYQTKTSVATGYDVPRQRATNANVASYVEGPIRITTGSDASNTTGSIRIGEGRVLRIKDGENFELISGCTNPLALNYNQSANLNDGSCILPVYGCTNPNSVNYNPFANTDDGSCAIAGCTDSTAINYNPLATTENGTCQYVTNGTFTNTNQTTTHIDNSYINNPTVQNLTTTGNILMRTSGEVYVGPYNTTTFNTSGNNFKQIYTVGVSASAKPNLFENGNILILRNGNRKYTDDNTSISNNLPAAYKQPISQEQLCSNCAFYDPSTNNNCSRWNAKVRANYWCAKYKPEEYLTPAGDTFRSIFPGIIQKGLNTGGNEFLLANRSFYVGSYRIMPDGVYFADDVLPFRLLTLKQTLKFGPNRHFTKINKNITGNKPMYGDSQGSTTATTQPATQPTTSPTYTSPTSTPATSTGGTGTSYSY